MLENIPLAPFTTLGIGGPARWFAELQTEQDLLQALDFAHKHQLPTFVLGGGSNLLVADAGFNGVVLNIKLTGVTFTQQTDRVLISAAAGESWDAVVSLAVERNLAGIECLAGIPGTVGGTPVQNVGAYGQEVSESIHRVRAYDTHTREFVELTAEQCEFSYRLSRFNSTDSGRFIITQVDYLLSPDVAPRVEYKDLREYFKEASQPPSLASVASAVREIRNRKGMLLVDGEPDCRSAGSFFKNPIVAREKFHALAATLGVSVDSIPSYPAAAGTVKLSSAWLLDQAGFHRGYRLGRAGISSRHTLALINAGGATAAEIIALRDLICSTVQQKFSITLEQEPVMLGF